jgi:phage terminase large subunit-like protein
MSQSLIVQILTDLVRLGVAEEELAKLTEAQLLAIGSTWELWQRPSQRIPPEQKLDETLGMTPDKPWPLWGRTWPGVVAQVLLMIGGRGTGKTTSTMRYAHRMAMTMQWPSFLCVAQNEEKAVQLFVKAEHGLIEGAPPWERPYKTAGEGGKGLVLKYPSGAEAVIASAGGAECRGPEYYGALCEEIAYWPHGTCVDSWDAILDAVRLGDGQVIAATTPSDGHPVIKKIKDDAEVDKTVQWVRLPPGANSLFLKIGYEASMRRRYAGTHKYAEEVEGLEGGERGLVKRADIEAGRRELATIFKRRIVVMDPTGADPKRSQKVDTVGLMEWGLCLDEQLMPLQDRTATMHPEVYAAAAVVMYIRGKCDCMVIETDRGGVLPTSMVRAAARDIKAPEGEDPKVTTQLRELREALNGTVWRVVEVEVGFRTRFQHGTIYVREVRTYADRPTRASLLGQLYHQHRVSHPRSVNLDSYETTLTTHEFKPREKSPGDLDCGTWAAVELLGKYQDLKMGAKGHGAINKAAREQQAKARPGRRVEPVRVSMATGRRADTRGRI